MGLFITFVVIEGVVMVYVERGDGVIALVLCFAFLNMVGLGCYGLEYY